MQNSIYFNNTTGKYPMNNFNNNPNNQGVANNKFMGYPICKNPVYRPLEPNIPEGSVFAINNQSTVTNQTAKQSISNTTKEKENALIQKKNDALRNRMFTGTVDRVIKWNKVYNNFCYYEVISSIISIQEGSVRLQKIMLLKDRKGPILQVVHYVNDHINIDDFYVGQVLRCVGRMVGPNILHAVSIRAATDDEITGLQRLCYICEHAIAREM